jgi:hypothetical protein
MSVIPVRRWAQGAVLSALGVSTLVACDDPEANTELRPEGPPVVLSVTVGNDPGGFAETATYCRPNDPKRPTFVALLGDEVCSGEDPAAGATEVTDAVPTYPYVRIQFDELLDNSIQTLTEVLDPDTGEPTGVFTGTVVPKDPVTLECGGTEVTYEGYYQPAGNSVTWPLGPSLVIFPEDPSTVAAGSSCTLTLNTAAVLDKQGEAATDMAPFTFGVAGLEIVETDPEQADDPAEAAFITTDSVVSILFNGFVDPTSLAANEVVLRIVTSCETPTTVTTEVAAIGGETGAIEITDAGATAPLTFDANVSYVVEFAAGATVTDAAGAVLTLPGPDEFSHCFTTEAP